MAQILPSVLDAITQGRRLNENNFMELSVPTDAAVDEKTVKEQPDEVPGEITEQLSDMTDEEDDQYSGRPSRRVFSSWYKHIRPIVKNERVRKFAILNFLLGFICSLLLVAVAIYGILVIILELKIAEIHKREVPCLYQWSEWSACSATCRSGKNPPSKFRKIIPDSFISARGKYPACPNGMKNYVDSAPCNIYKCPRKLSEFTNWTECFYRDPAERKYGCYMMRKLPMDDQLIKIDTDDFIRNCTCKNWEEMA